MADGDLLKQYGMKRGSAAHTDGTATVVASVTLPSTEGYYTVRGFAAGGKAGLSSKYSLAVAGCVYVDGGAAGVGESLPMVTSASGYTIAITVSGLAVRVSVTAENGVYSAGFIEVLSGVELAISPA